MTENQFWPKGQKNFFESGGFAMGRSGYLKHEYYFAPFMIANSREGYTSNRYIDPQVILKFFSRVSLV